MLMMQHLIIITVKTLSMDEQFIVTAKELGHNNQKHLTLLSNTAIKSPTTLQLPSLATSRFIPIIHAASTILSNSAPVKFWVRRASSPRSTSFESFPASRNFCVCMVRIWRRAGSSGSWVSRCTSNRPGRRRASSTRSRRLVVPERINFYIILIFLRPGEFNLIQRNPWYLFW